jgi:hypothetical protein
MIGVHGQQIEAKLLGMPCLDHRVSRIVGIRGNEHSDIDVAMH